ncbi:MAG: DEAD/DEAH box helicase family protein [Helicobacteraceae bacterium]|jgi:type III restriction enzyme|nr:DEAD/DEAH box helicase family protein [Helicobacteraceae bacterium]
MLQEIIDLQQSAVKQLVAELKKKNEITFKAPTGSGKTYMMADFMNRVIAEKPNVVFLVSSLSKGDLARQNYEKFEEYKEKGNFPNLNPYLINSEIAGEERLFIPAEYNVYLLPRDLYKRGGRLMQGSMTAFLKELKFFKKIFLIKDECHIETKNLNSLSDYFEKTVNFSATPKLTRGQHPDVEIKNGDAENAKLIKTIEWGEETDTVSDAIAKFEEVKENYRNLLRINPCLIIQISNKDKADEELQNKIKPALKAKPDIKWMLIVDKEKECDTNDVFKAKKMPVAKWKDYAKTSAATIDVIIFKMVITEGWDIPRACMLYQVRDTQSKQLDEQVVGRVRRNPRLSDFEILDEKAQKLAMTAWVWGVESDEQKKVIGVKLYDEPQETIENVKIKTTKLKKLSEKTDFNLSDFLSKQKE